VGDKDINKEQVVHIFTDGACSGNPGVGGWAAILRYGNHEKELCGGEKQTTNNRMELTAIIQGLEALKRPCRVVVYTDSKYICDAINKGWLENWKKKGWRRNRNQPLKNMEMWKKLEGLLSVHKVSFVWVRGHSGHRENERCDALAKREIEKIKGGLST